MDQASILLILLIIIIITILFKHGNRENLTGLDTVKLPENYVHCANENSTCNITKPTLVYYGVDDKYYSRTINSAFDCEVTLFGDPDFGKNKSCYIPKPETTPEEQRPSNSSFEAFRGHLPRNKTTSNNVIYDTNERYAVKKIIDGFVCNNTIFGTDAKSCYVQAV